MNGLRALRARDIRAGVSRRPPIVVLAVLGLLTAWSVGYELVVTVWRSLDSSLPFAGVAPDIAFGMAGALLIVRGWRGPRAWLLIGLGAWCWAAGDVYWSIHLAKMSDPPVPSWADAGYLSFCPLTLVGIVMLVRGRASKAPGVLVADSAVAALAVGSLSAGLVLKPVLDAASGGFLSVATNLAYPLVDLVLLGLMVGATALNNWKLDRTWGLLGAAIVSCWIADSLYLVTVATDSYSNLAWFNPLWYWSPVLAAWAAWLPVAANRTGDARRPAVRGIAMSLAFACLGLGVLVWSSFAALGLIPVLLATGALLVMMLRLALTWRENAALLGVSREEALTDALTLLGNRRALMSDLAQWIARAHDRPCLLVLFDLDGFKHYNDQFGHPAGDALLRRLGHNLQLELGELGTAYRMGGDEFCALIDDPAQNPEALRCAVSALSERGEGFDIGCSYGSVVLPQEANDSENAMRIADQRMYAQKRGGRASALRQSKDVLLRALAERSPDLGTHMHDVAELAAQVAERLELTSKEVEQIRQAAELHDVGKVAIPDAILEKPGPLDEHEWEFMRRHTMIGERILSAAPVLTPVAALVRSSHEKFDGTGYPDGLRAHEIPIGARVVFVCDAFNAMTTNRAYRNALSIQQAIVELNRCAGSQFDPRVVTELIEILTDSSEPDVGRRQLERTPEKQAHQPAVTEPAPT